MHSKGSVPRQITSVIGIIRWKRRVGRCPYGCAIGQVAPLDNTVGLPPHQRTSVELQKLGCLLAIFAPFETVAVLLNCLISVQVSPAGVWYWVQTAGQKAMDRLNDQLTELAAGQLPQMELLNEAISVLPLLIGADGVMVPFRPEGGKSRTVRREVKMAVLARLGRIDALHPRLWLEALRQGVLTAPQGVWFSDGGIGFGVFILLALQPTLLEFWTFVIQPKTCGREPKHGLMDIARRSVCSLLRRVTYCDMVRRI